MKVDLSKVLPENQVRGLNVAHGKGDVCDLKDAKGLAFTRPKKEQWPQCAYCSTRATKLCDAAGCETVMCDKHKHTEGPYDFCREHVQQVSF